MRIKTDETVCTILTGINIDEEDFCELSFMFKASRSTSMSHFSAMWTICSLYHTKEKDGKNLN